MSPRLLAIDTTRESGSIALIEGDRVVEEVPFRAPDGFAHVVFGEIAKLLDRHGVKLGDIDAFASASGPGTFTGVRVGLAAVKGLAEASGRKVVAVSNLQALSFFGTRALRATVIDARRGEIYGAVYDEELRPVCAEVVQQLSEWLKTLPHGDIEFITNGFPVGCAPVTEAPSELAGAIGRIAAVQFAAGLARDPAEIDANYVRRSDAELLWKEP